MNSGHNGPMEQLSTVTSSRPRGIDAAASALKQAADSRAAALASTIRELMATGFVSQCALADELNRSGIPTARGGSWHRTTVARVLIRLGLITSGQGNNGLAIRRIADARAEAVGPTIRELRKAGFVSSLAIARELNEREIPTARGCKWHRASVDQLLLRLKRLSLPRELLSPPTSDGEPGHVCQVRGRVFVCGEGASRTEGWLQWRQ